MTRRVQPLTIKHLDLLARASIAIGDEGVPVGGSEAISAQSLRRRGLVKLANRRATEGINGYLAFITTEGREELARYEKRATRQHADKSDLPERV